MRAGRAGAVLAPFLGEVPMSSYATFRRHLTRRHANSWATALLATLAASCNAGGGDDKLFGGNAAGATGATGGAGAAGGADGAGGSLVLGSGGAVTTFADGGCNRLEIGFEKIHPTVMLLIDRSGSMFDQAYGTSPDRWAPLKTALMDPAGPVRALESDIRWGYTSYTSDAQRAAECPMLHEVGVAFNNYAAISTAYDADSVMPAFKAETPTGVSLRTVAGKLAQVTDPGPKFIILATDGEPDTCATPDPQCGQDESIRAVQDAFQQQIKTFVVGISSEVGKKHLQDLANAGVGQPVEAPNSDFINNCVNPGHASRTATYASGPAGSAAYYNPTDPQALENDLRSILGNVRTCNFSLNAKVDLTQASLGQVALDGTTLTYETPDGWRMTDETHLEVTGAACQSILTNGKVLSINFPCGVAQFIR